MSVADGGSTGAWPTAVRLLDANVLIALTVVDHVHHDVVEQWFAAAGGQFATCPITQGALVRTVVRGGGTVRQAVAALQGLAAHTDHRFWADAVTFADVQMNGVVGHRQVTDAYLAQLARHHGGRLVTLDRGLAVLAGDVTDLLAV